VEQAVQKLLVMPYQPGVAAAMETSLEGLQGLQKPELTISPNLL
jgi:hypothetical protein